MVPSEVAEVGEGSLMLKEHRCGPSQMQPVAVLPGIYFAATLEEAILNFPDLNSFTEKREISQVR